MVFSFFKKEPQKMVSRPAAVPRGREAPSDTSSKGGSAPAATPVSVGKAAASTPAAQAPKVDDTSLDFSEFEFSEFSTGFHVEEEVDPVDAEAEEAAVLFANGQDAVARSVLERAVQSYHNGAGERLWMMLFDFYKLNGQATEFEKLENEFVRVFEKSPPIWRNRAKAPAKAKEAQAGSILFKGDLTGENQAAFEPIRQALQKNNKLRLDMSKVTCIDTEGCHLLMALLQQARKAKKEIELLGRDGLGALVEERVEPGRAEDSECWLLLLELCQLQGQQEAFDEVAINYAVTFEVSPPSWEANRVAAPEPPPQLSVETPNDPAAEVYRMYGDIKGLRFGDLPAYAELHDPVIIDCSDLTRIDFVSAGVLLNVLTTIRSSGKQIVFRHPNHLVAELFRIVGVKAMATVVFAKS